jgi:hypothetical protein
MCARAELADRRGPQAAAFRDRPHCGEASCLVGATGFEPVTSSVSDPTTNYADVIRGWEAGWRIMGNAQVHAAVGVRVTPQFIMIPPRYSGPSKGRLLPVCCPSAARAHLTTAAPKLRAPQQGSPGFGWWLGCSAPRRASRIEGCTCAECRHRRGRPAERNAPWCTDVLP